MGTFSFEKAPIPLFVNRSRQIAPSYSYYGCFNSGSIRRLALNETRIRFCQTLSGLLPRTSSDQADPTVRARRLFWLGRDTAGGHSLEWLLTLSTWKASFSKIGPFGRYLEEMERLPRPPERVVSAASLSWCDLSEAGPHGPVLFQIRLRSFFPKEDRPGLFTPGEKPFISHLV